MGAGKIIAGLLICLLIGGAIGIFIGGCPPKILSLTDIQEQQIRNTCENDYKNQLAKCERDAHTIEIKAFALNRDIALYTNKIEKLTKEIERLTGDLNCGN